MFKHSQCTYPAYCQLQVKCHHRYRARHADEIPSSHPRGWTPLGRHRQADAGPLAHAFHFPSSTSGSRSKGNGCRGRKKAGSSPRIAHGQRAGGVRCVPLDENRKAGESKSVSGCWAGSGQRTRGERCSLRHRGSPAAGRSRASPAFSLGRRRRVRDETELIPYSTAPTRATRRNDGTARAK